MSCLQRDNVVRLIDEFCRKLICRVRQEYEFETDNVNDLSGALSRTCCRVDHSSKFARQLVEHGRPVDVVALAPIVRSSLAAAARASLVPIDARLAVKFRPRAVGVDDVEPVVGSVDVDRVPSEYHTTTVDRPLQHSSCNEGSGGGVRSGVGRPAAATLEPDLSDAVHEPILLSSFPARTATDSKGCKPTAVAATSSDEDAYDGTTLIVVVDDINKKVKVFDDAGELQLEICPEGRRRLVDPWDVAVLRQQRPLAAAHGTAAPGRYVVTDRGAKDVKVIMIIIIMKHFKARITRTRALRKT